MRLIRRGLAAFLTVNQPSNARIRVAGMDGASISARTLSARLTSLESMFSLSWPKPVAPTMVLAQNQRLWTKATARVAGVRPERLASSA